MLLVDKALRDRVEAQIEYVVAQRPSDQELHREIIDALGVLAIVGLFGSMPTLRENVPYGAGDRFIVLARARLRRIDDIVEHQVPLIERVVRAGELDWSAAVLFEEVGHLGRAS